MLFRFAVLNLLVTANFYLAFFAQAQSNVPVAVTFPKGATIVGESNEGVDSFLGIQYGTVGERFSTSSPVTILQDGNESVVVNATSFGPDCYQSVPELPIFVHQPRPEAEECLFLNIWRPSGIVSDEDPSSTSSSSSSSVPIMVWIHGGGFIVGSGAEQQYYGGNLARDQNVMVISINYRLGALGFLPQDSDGTGAMNGLLDQILALQWVQANAPAFGGDVGRVTIFGESSGGEAVCMLSVSPLSEGLFHRAIMQSGECTYNHWMGGVPNEDIDSALQAVDSLMNATGVSSLQELKDPSLVDGASLNMLALATGLSIPVLDKDVLPRHPRELYRDASNFVPTDFLIGSNSNEDLTFFGMPPEEYLQLAESGLNSSVHSLVGSVYGPEVAEDVLMAYDADAYYGGDKVLAFGHFHGDWYFGCPARAIASDAAQVLPPIGNVYWYHFAHFAVTDPLVLLGYEGFVNTTGWASHMAEIPYVFGTMDVWTTPNGTTISSQDYQLNREIMTRWGNFAKTGNPNSMTDTTEVGDTAVGRDGGIEGLAIWEPLSVSNPRTMLFVEGQGRMSALEVKAEQCAAFPFGNDIDENDDITSGGGTWLAMWWCSGFLFYVSFGFLFW